MKVKTIIVPRKDYIILDWLRNHHSKGQPIDWFQRVLLNSGKSEIEAGQFINKYMTYGILVKKGNGYIAINCGVDSTVKFNYSVSED